jgi:hypothetical protein
MDFNFKKIAADIASIAPGLGAAIGGPTGATVGLGIKTLAKFFGVDTQAADAKAQLDGALERMTPDQAIELKALDKQFIMSMKKLEVDVFKLEIEDKDSAREMQQSTNSFVPSALTFVLAIVAGYLVYQVFNNQLSGIDKTLVGTVIGYVFSELKQATSFWFGSSKGSQDKTVHLGKK